MSRAVRARDALTGAVAPLLSSVLVVCAAFVLLLALVAAMGYSPADTAKAFIEGAFGSSDQLAATITVMIPLTLLGLAWIVATSARQLNLGLEGQILAGGIGATIVGANLNGLPPALHVALTVLAAAAAGAIWAALPALLYAWRDIGVLLPSFMLNFVAALFVAYLIRGPLKSPFTVGLVESKPVSLDSQWPHIGSSGLRFDVFLIPLMVIGLVVVQRLTTIGFRLRIISSNEHAAEHVGMATKRIGASAMLISGAVAGVAGCCLILDSLTGSMSNGFSSGYGFLGIAVALLARNSAVGCIASGLLFAAMQQGGALVETRVGLPSPSVEVAQGVVIVLVALSAWFLVRLGRARASSPAEPELSGNV